VDARPGNALGHDLGPQAAPAVQVGGDLAQHRHVPHLSHPGQLPSTVTLTLLDAMVLVTGESTRSGPTHAPAEQFMAGICRSCSGW
jgi:hypothetical protein